MLATSARIVPCIALASAFAALKVSVSPDCSMLTVGPKRRDSEPSGPLTEISPPAIVTSTFGGSLIGLLPIRDIVSAPRQATMQSTSPPTPVARALRSVITPCDVDTMAIPSPFITRGMSSLLL